jgi:hypothetical protein
VTSLQTTSPKAQGAAAFVGGELSRSELANGRARIDADQFD